MISDIYNKAKAGARAVSNMLTGMDDDRKPSLGSLSSTSKESVLPQNTAAGPPAEKTPVLSLAGAGQHVNEELLGKAKATVPHGPTSAMPPVSESASKRLLDTAFGAVRGADRAPGRAPVVGEIQAGSPQACGSRD